MDEKIDLLDNLGRKTGVSKERLQAHIDGDWHASSHVWFIKSDNSILMQKRSAKKKLFPGKWVAPASGHISTGSDAVSTALIETQEELGIDIREEDIFLQATVRGEAMDPNVNIGEKEYINIFIVLKDIQVNLDIHNDEVDGFKWFSLEEFQKLVETEDPSLVPAFEEYDIIISYIKRNRL